MNLERAIEKVQTLDGRIYQAAEIVRTTSDTLIHHHWDIKLKQLIIERNKCQDIVHELIAAERTCNAKG